MKKVLLMLILQLSTIAGFAQTNTLSIEECYKLTIENYPLIRQQDLITQASRYSIENASRQYLPQLSFSGQATYQSETINFQDAFGDKLPVSLPVISKDQYKIQGEISQAIYDGGATRNQKEHARLNAEVQQQGLQVSLYALRERVNQIYFSILLMSEQGTQNDLRKVDLQSLINKTTAALQNGTAFRSQVDELKAELSNAELSGIESRENLKAYQQMLSVLIGRPVDENTVLIVPLDAANNAANLRPELRLYDLRKKTYELQEKNLRTEYLPRLNAFFQGAYGRPTLNFIKDEFGFWYISGLRFNWNIGSLYTLGNRRRLLNIQRENVALEQEVFLYNSNLTTTQEAGEIRKYKALIRQDDTTISLRASVKKSARAQVENGVITTHDYIAQVNAENIALQSRILHRMQLLRAQYNLKTTLGD